MSKEENYYEIEKRIYDILHKIKNVTQENASDIYSEAHCLIFEYEFLKQNYTNKIHNVLKLLKSEKYNNIIKSNYNKVKKYVKEQLKNKNVKITYIDEKKENPLFTDEYELSVLNFPYPNYCFVQNKMDIINELIEEGFFDFESGNIEDDWYDNCTSYAELIDIPSLFIYESVLSLGLNEYSEESINKVDICSWNNLSEFYIETFGICFFEFIEIPQNIDIEYLIIASNIGKFYHNTKFHLYIAITSLRKIFNDFLRLIYEELNKKYGFKIPEYNTYKQHINSHIYIVKISRKIDKNHLFIDEKPVENISKLDLDFIEQVFKNIYDTENGDFSEDPYLSKRKYNINKNILNVIGNEVGYKKESHLIVRDKHTKKYTINKQLYNIQITN